MKPDATIRVLLLGNDARRRDAECQALSGPTFEPEPVEFATHAVSRALEKHYDAIVVDSARTADDGQSDGLAVCELLQVVAPHSVLIILQEQEAQYSEELGGGKVHLLLGRCDRDLAPYVRSRVLERRRMAARAQS